jgi:hypothetical protein
MASAIRNNVSSIGLEHCFTRHRRLQIRGDGRDAHQLQSLRGETHLPLDHPTTQTNIILSRCSVSPPRLMGFGGSVVTEKYLFGFGHDHLANFWQWEFGQAISSLNRRF